MQHNTDNRNVNITTKTFQRTSTECPVDTACAICSFRKKNNRKAYFLVFFVAMLALCLFWPSFY